MLLFVQLVIFYGFYYGKSPFFTIIWIFFQPPRFQANLSIWVLPPLAAFVQSAIFFEIHWLMCLEVRKDDGNLLHLLFVMQKAGNIDGKPSYSYYLCKIHYIGLMGSPNVLLLFMSGSSLIRSLPGQAHPSMRMQYAYLFLKSLPRNQIKMSRKI